MTTMQNGPEGRLNAMWTSDDFGNGYETRLGLYIFDAEGEPANTILLTAEGLANLAAFIGARA